VGEAQLQALQLGVQLKLGTAIFEVAHRLGTQRVEVDAQQLGAVVEAGQRQGQRRRQAPIVDQLGAVELFILGTFASLMLGAQLLGIVLAQ